MKGQTINLTPKTRSVYGGQVLATPLMFNPNAADIKRLKNLSEGTKVDEPVYKRTIMSVEYQMVSLLLKFSPSELLNDKSHYDNAYVKYEFAVSKDLVQGKAKKYEPGLAIEDHKDKIIPGKYQVIDNHNRIGWIHIDDGQTANEAIFELAKNLENTEFGMKYKSTGGYYYNEKDPIVKMAKEKIEDMHVRIARIGEVALYDLLFNMSSFAKYKAKDNPADEVQFFIGDSLDKATEEFEKICDGDMSLLNSFTLSAPGDLIHNFVNDGKQTPIGILLGAREYNGKLSQDVYTPATFVKVSTPCTFRSIANTYVRDGIELQIPTELYESVNSKKYPWTSHITKDYKFGVVNYETISEAAKESNTSVDPMGMSMDAGIGMEMPGMDAIGLNQDDDDLPF